MSSLPCRVCGQVPPEPPGSWEHGGSQAACRCASLPTLEESLDRLSFTLYLSSGDRSLFGTDLSAPRLGPALLLVDEADLDRVVLPAGYRPSRAGGLWDLMRELAPLGYPGFRLISPPCLTVQFAGRVDELVGDGPTVMVIGVDALEGPLGLVGRSGVLASSDEEVRPWRRFDLRDRLLLTPGTTPSTPFPGWSPSDGLWTLAFPEEEAVLSTVRLDELGPWMTGNGCELYFISRSMAAEYLMWARRFAQELHLSIRNPREPERLSSWSVDDLEVRHVARPMTHLAKRWARAGHYAINPGSGRSLVGIGDLRFPNIFRTTAGYWEFDEESDSVRLVLDIPDFMGGDTFYWKGDHTLALEYPSRSFAPTHEAGWTHAEAVEGAATLLRADSSPPDTVLDAYLIVSTDRVWEDRHLRFFASPLDGWAWLAEYAGSVDERVRVEGTNIPHVPGLAGSHDAEAERRTSASLLRAVERTTIRYLAEGYSPSLSEALEAAANETLVSASIEAMGPVKDLIWSAAQLPADAPTGLWDAPLLPDILLASGGQRHAVEAWLVSVGELAVDANGERDALERLPREAWSSLTPRSRHFIATALDIFRRNGGSPQVDYSPVVLPVAKALEVELVELVSRFRDGGDGLPPVDAQAPRSEELLSSFLGGRAKLTLGNFPFLLKAEQSGTGPLWERWLDYLAEHPEGAVLLSRPYRRGVSKLVEKYRNAAVHDSAISADDCSDALNIVLGGSADTGLLEPLPIQNPDAPLTNAAADSPSGMERAVNHLHARIRRDDDRTSGRPPPSRQQHAAGLPIIEGHSGGYTLALLRPDFVVMVQPGAAVRLFYLPQEPAVLFQWGLRRSHLMGLHRALERSHVAWSASAAFEVSGPKDGRELNLRFASPGTRARLSLDAEERRHFTEFIARVADGEYGDIGDRIQDSTSEVVERIVSFLFRK